VITDHAPLGRRTRRPRAPAAGGRVSPAIFTARLAGPLLPLAQALSHQELRRASAATAMRSAMRGLVCALIELAVAAAAAPTPAAPSVTVATTAVPPIGGAHWALKTSDAEARRPTKSGYNQKEFVISMFIEPRPTLFNYKLIADANFTTVLQEHAVNNATARAKSIALCAQLGLDVIAVSDGGGVHGPMPAGPVLGVYIRDEPPASEFPGLAHLVAGVRREHPEWLSFINLLPYYPSGPGAVPHLGTSSYRDYLDQFITIVDPDILCFDAYPGQCGERKCCSLLAAESP